MKKIMNSAETLVREMCNGMVMAHPELEFLNKYKVVKKKDINEDKVTLISGGGSGHEPAHAGFIGCMWRCICFTFTNTNLSSDKSI